MEDRVVKALPDGLDSQVFVGRRVDSVMFFEFMVAIGFDSSTPTAPNGFALSIYGRYVHEVPDDPVEDVVVEQRMRRSALMRLCGRIVAASEPSRLRLTMDDGQVLSVPVDGGPYESFSVTISGREFVV